MLEPGPNWEAFVENLPDERAHLSWARVVPESGRHLSGRGVSNIKVLQEGFHVGRVGQFANVGVAPLGGVPVKGGITQGRVWLPMLFSRVPGEVKYESYVENLV